MKYSVVTPVDPRDIDVPTTIGQALLQAATNWPDAIALVEGDRSARPRSWTFTELAKDAVRVARALLRLYTPGERVAMWASNRPEWVLVQLGAALAGLTLVTVNPAYGENELRYVLRHSRSHGIVVEPTVRSRDLLAVLAAVRDDLPDLRVVTSLAQWDEFLVGVTDTRTELPPVGPRDPAQIQYTSGTTGFPKGALLAHAGLTLNGRSFAAVIGARVGDVWVNPMPLFHTAGCGLVTLGALQTGGCHILPPTFDADLMLDLIERHRGTLVLSVPTMLIRMLEARAGRERELSSWRLTALGGAPVPVELVRRATRELGVEVTIGFGQTESSPYITHTRPHDPHPRWAETIGPPLPWAAVKVVDPETDDTVPRGVIGEICARGECVMLGYFDDPEASASAIDVDGWLHTGDLGDMDEHGYLRIKGRLKDLIIRGGENIYPREIEDALHEHPDIVDVAVVGLPDDHWGEIVAAFARLRSGRELDRSELAAFCRARLASYKVPAVWEVVTGFPLTASGKIQKFALRQLFLASRNQADHGPM